MCVCVGGGGLYGAVPSFLPSLANIMLRKKGLVALPLHW